MARRTNQGLTLAALLLLTATACSDNSKPETNERGACLRQDGTLRAGFAAVDLSPEFIEGYVDENGNQEYDPGEETIDTNGNGEWEPLWIAGFGNGRAAQGIHDPVWARTMVLARDREAVSFTVVDSVGLLPRTINEIRRRVLETAGKCWDLDEGDIIVAATHTHEAPDTMGMWGEYFGVTGIVPRFQEQVMKGAADSVTAALDKMVPVAVRFAKADAPPDINADSRYPWVIDNDVYAAQFVDADGETVGSLVEFSMHPEVLWSRNDQITSDFPHFTRERMEEALGGISVFAVGMIGGLMTPKSDVHTFEQAATTGTRIADVALEALAEAESVDGCSLRVNKAMAALPMDNGAFRLLVQGQILDASEEELVYEPEQCSVSGCIMTPVVAVDLCDGVAQMATVPGELFPELGMGGFAQPLEWDDRDMHNAPAGTPLRESLKYPNAPLEKPIRSEIMTADYRFVFGLANAEFGYIVPKSQWDPTDYEESVSLGPDTAPLLAEILDELFTPFR